MELSSKWAVLSEGGGQSAVTDVQGYGFGRLITVQEAQDVFEFRNIRCKYSVDLVCLQCN